MRAPTTSWWWNVTPLPLLVAAGLRLADVVEQRGEPSALELLGREALATIALDVLDDRDRVGQDVLVAVDRILLEPHRRQLGQELVGQSRVDDEPQAG